MLASCAAGTGGAGGGSIELTADGNVTVGSITANGGNGGSASGGSLSGAGGGGGGGAGGVVMVRAGGTITAPALSAVGGSGGGAVNGGGAGGAGSVGRIRFDAAAGTASGTPAAHRGPAFDAATPTSVTIPSPSITLSGTDGDGFTVSVTDQLGTQRIDSTLQVFGAQDTIVITPSLQRGYNHLCVILENGQRDTSEGQKCIDLAMLP